MLIEKLENDLKNLKTKQIMYKNIASKKLDEVTALAKELQKKRDLLKLADLEKLEELKLTIDTFLIPEFEGLEAKKIGAKFSKKMENFLKKMEKKIGNGGADGSIAKD